MNSNQAEIVALQALAYLAADDRRIEGFCRMTGTPPAALRTLVDTRGGLAAILEYLLRDEGMLVAFADEAGMQATDPAAAHRTLAGESVR